jgi:two-component system NtrC family sensor kinase
MAIPPSASSTTSSASPGGAPGGAGDASLALVRRVTAFGQELAGTLRRASVIDLLMRHIRDGLQASEVTVGLFNRDSAGIEVVHTWPSSGADRHGLLELASRRGPVLVESEVTRLLQEAGLSSPPDILGSWCVAPLVAKGRVTGAAAVRSLGRTFGPADLALLEGLAAQASIALESARLVDLHDDGRRSWQEVVDAISLALCIVDRSGRIRRANRAFAELVDAPPAALIGRPWHAFTPPEWATEIRRAIELPPAGTEVELRTGDRSYTVSAVPISDTDRSAIVLLFDDQTERRRLQEQLVQSEKMSAIGQLIAGIAHDLNNPLASVVGFADFLGEVRDVPPQLREPLTVIREEAERASNIVKNLLSFARKQEHQRRRTSLRQLLESTFLLLRNQLLAYHVEYRLELDAELPDVDVDPNQIQQVFVNLINNAAQAIAVTGQSGMIEVRGRRWMDGVAIDVSDTGPGMSEALQAQVFEPFFTTKPEGQGTGLGLSISQGIVKEHGGRITLASEEGTGATFTVHLPLSSREPVTETPVSPRPAPPRLRVLVVDDEPHILHYMRATLEAWGHTVETASDGDDALARATREPYDLVISDLRMPRLGGREFYEELERRRPEMARRLVFSTGDTVRGDTLAFLERLDRPFLHKPFSLAELRSLLAAVGRESGPHRVVRESGAHTPPPDLPQP